VCKLPRDGSRQVMRVFPPVSPQPRPRRRGCRGWGAAHMARRGFDARADKLGEGRLGCSASARAQVVLRSSVASGAFGMRPPNDYSSRFDAAAGAVEEASSLPGFTVAPNWSMRAAHSRAASDLRGAFSRRQMVDCEASAAPGCRR
jgi:hypothetical protein